METIKAIVFLLTQSTLPESVAAEKQNANHASWKPIKTAEGDRGAEESAKGVL